MLKYILYECMHIQTHTHTHMEPAWSVPSSPAVSRAEGDLDIVMLICLSFVSWNPFRHTHMCTHTHTYTHSGMSTIKHIKTFVTNAVRVLIYTERKEYYRKQLAFQK